MNRGWKKLMAILIAIGSLLWNGSKSLAAFNTSVKQNDQQNLIAQRCSNSEESARPFAEVVTQSTPLNIRSTPSANGRIVGKVPKGWQVIILKTDSSGNWAYITNEYGQWYSGSILFGSAPDFRSNGWVRTSYLKRLGNSCEKPLRLNQRGLLPFSPEKQHTVLMNEEWLHLSDRIAQNMSQK